MYELLFSSQQPLAKKLRKHCCNVMFPHIRKQLTNKMVEEHQRAIRERENVIEEKDAAIALLNDDLEDLEHENCELQNEVERLQEWYVPYLQDTIKDNGMAVVNGAAGGVGSLVSCEIYQKINVHKTVFSVLWVDCFCLHCWMHIHRLVLIHQEGF